MVPAEKPGQSQNLVAEMSGGNRRGNPNGQHEPTFKGSLPALQKTSLPKMAYHSISFTLQGDLRLM
jgi:hypothetical protein